MTIHTALLTPRTLLVPLLILLNIWRRCKLALRPNLLAIQIKENRHRRQHNRHTPNKRAGPLYTHPVEHLCREQRKDTAKNGPHKRIRCDRRGGKHQVRIDNVVQQRQENTEDAEARKQAAQDGHNPGYVAAVACPAEPEEAAGEQDAADHADGQSPFGDGDVVVGFELRDVAWISEDDDDKGDKLAGDHSEIGEAGDAGGPAVDALEDKGVCCQDCWVLGVFRCV